jgi:hypothetical protein
MMNPDTSDAPFVTRRPRSDAVNAPESVAQAAASPD